METKLALFYSELPDAYSKIPCVDGFASMKPHVLVRFGEWEEILRRSTPRLLSKLDPKLHIPQKTAWLYARAMAMASSIPSDNKSTEFNIENAQAAFDEFSEYLASVKDTMHYINYNTNYAIMSVGKKVAEAELLYRRAEFEADLTKRECLLEKVFSLLDEGKYKRGE